MLTEFVKTLFRQGGNRFNTAIDKKFRPMLTTLDERAVPDASPISPPQSPVASQITQSPSINDIGTLTPGSWLGVDSADGNTFWFGVGGDGGLWLLTPADNYATPNYITTLSNVSQVPVPPSVMPAVPGKTPPAMMLPNAPSPIIPPPNFVGPPAPPPTTTVYGPIQVIQSYSPNITMITINGNQSSIVINNTTGQVTIVIVRNNVSTFTWILVPPYR